ncbi:MAG: hypothetical protein IJ899_20325 [Blautia sp.]|nr:hypothetical protein [Blautia sp.]
MKKTAILMILVLLLTAPVSITAQTCDLRQAKTEMTAKTGIYEYKGHWYLYKNGRKQYGHIKYKGNYYYAHRTSSRKYPRGSLTKGQFRIESGNRWFAYSIDHGKMYVKNHYVRKGRFKRYLDLAIRKDRTVAYVYDNSSTVRGAIRYSTRERRLQRDLSFGQWKTIEGMQFIPDGWVDTQR